MSSPHQVLAALIAEVFPERVGLAGDIATGMLYRLTEAGYTVAIVDTPEPDAAAAGPPLHDAPKTFRIDRWLQDGSALEEHVAGVCDYQVAIAAFEAAVTRWPNSAVTLRQGTRVLMESRRY